MDFVVLNIYSVRYPGVKASDCFGIDCREFILLAGDHTD